MFRFKRRTLEPAKASVIASNLPDAVHRVNNGRN
jgi:hypothetical protein